jgi:hypothetical protein
MATESISNSFGSESYKEQWTETLQEELDAPCIWKDICKVTYTDIKILHNPYYTAPTISTGTRGCPNTPAVTTITDDDTTIDTYSYVYQIIDRADAAQLGGYAQASYFGRQQGILVNETLEAAVWAGAFAGGTDMGTETFTNTAGASAITVSTTNIDEIVSAVKREIREAGGETIAKREGIFICWTPADFEILEKVMQANGFNLADYFLKNGTEQGAFWNGVYHYSSNFLTATHVVGGVKKGIHLGILKSTYGQLVTIQDPGEISGFGYKTRVDYKVKVWNKMSGLIFDINVAS